LGGVIALVLSIAILFILPFCNLNKFQGNQFYPLNKILYWIIVITIILLTWIGARPVEIPYILTGQLLTVVYFSYYLINPLVNKIWDELIN
jgi:ubiquinol-cytochrome c reductase cytochrome b subunit